MVVLPPSRGGSIAPKAQILVCSTHWGGRAKSSAAGEFFKDFKGKIELRRRFWGDLELIGKEFKCEFRAYWEEGEKN